MISYEKYAEIRDKKNLKDSEIARRANIPQSTFSDWKKGKSAPKMEKLQKISEALGEPLSYLVSIGDSELDIEMQKIEQEKANQVDRAMKLYERYANASPEIQSAVELLLKSVQ